MITGTQRHLDMITGTLRHLPIITGTYLDTCHDYWDTIIGINHFTVYCFTVYHLKTPTHDYWDHLRHLPMINVTLRHLPMITGIFLDTCP
jgi:hypothetical protein